MKSLIIIFLLLNLVSSNTQHNLQEENQNIKLMSDKEFILGIHKTE